MLIIQPSQAKGNKMLHPDFPVVVGTYKMTNEWSVTLPGKFNRRIENNDLVIWRPGMTLWIAIWGNDKGETKESRLNRIMNDMSPKALEVKTTTSSSILRLSYRLKEEEEQGAVAAFYCFAIGKTGQVEMAIYLDNESDVKNAQAILESLIEVNAL